MQAIVLASSSHYRSSLLEKLDIKFQCMSPDVDESTLANEMPEELSRRLGRAKALKVSSLLGYEHESGHIIIASDQVASCGNRLLGKPGSRQAASEQLRAMAGKTVNFFTSVYMLDTLSDRRFESMDITKAHLRDLDEGTIERYINHDQPMDCAGSFKVESLGIGLFNAIESNDPTALIGLPMISVCKGLRQFGLAVP